MRASILVSSLLLLAAAGCAPTRTVAPAPGPVILPPVGVPAPVVIPPPDIAAETRDALDLPPPERPSFDLGPVSPPNAASPDLGFDNGGISSEQEFGVVAETRSIEEDAARLEAARERFEVVEPTDLARPDGGANVVDYALREARPVGSSGAYRRGLLALETRAARACDGFVNPDAAQEAFLAAGGPQRDRRGLDPDGDGNACGWDPATYRSLVDGVEAEGDPLDATGIGVGGSAPAPDLSGLSDAAPEE